MFLKIMFFGVMPTYLIAKGLGVWWWLGYVLALLAYLHQLRVGGYVGAATNMVAAKITFERLTEEAQKEVERMAKTVIFACGGPRDASFANEAQRYGWYALSMRELRFPPVALIPGWNVVKNPFKVPPRMWIDSAIKTAMTKHGIEVEIN